MNTPAPANDLAATVVTALWDYLEQRKWGNSFDERLMVTKEGMLGVAEQQLAPTLDELARLRQTVSFYQSPCPEASLPDAPGFTQGEGYFWKHRAEAAESALRLAKSALGNSRPVYGAEQNFGDAIAAIDAAMQAARQKLPEVGKA